MRKMSYLLAAMAAAAFGLTCWYANRAAATYEARYGAPAEGKGLLGIWFLGLRAFLLFAFLAFVCAALAYKSQRAPREVARLLELAVFLLPIVAVILLVRHMVPNPAAALNLIAGVKIF